MYEMLMMIKPGERFSPKEMAALLSEVCDSGEGEIEQDGRECLISAGDAYIQLDFDDAEHVLEESNEIAARFGLPCQGCAARWEMEGEDPDMDLFNDHLLICETLYATGKFVIFNPVEEDEFTA